MAARGYHGAQLAASQPTNSSWGTPPARSRQQKSPRSAEMHHGNSGLAGGSGDRTSNGRCVIVAGMKAGIQMDVG